MFAEIITIGDELLIGQVVDTNSAWMGQELNKIGIEVLRIVSIRDREKEILEAIDNAMERVNCFSNRRTRTYQRRYHQTNFMQILSYRTGFQRRSIQKCKTGTGRENTNECTQQKPGNGSERLYSDK